MKKNLVIGFGSDVLSDRGVVPRLLTRIKPSFTHQIDFIFELVNSLDLIHQLDGYKNLLVVDSIIDPEKESGSIHFFDFDTFFTGLHLENYHDSSLRETLQTAIELGYPVPAKIGVVLINVVEIHTLSTIFSKEIEEKFPHLQQQMRAMFVSFFGLVEEKILIV